MNLRNLSNELKRRSVYKVAVAYGVVAWFLIQVSDIVFPRLHLPDWAVTTSRGRRRIAGLVPALKQTRHAPSLF